MSPPVKSGAKTCVANSKPRPATVNDTNAAKARNSIIGDAKLYASNLIAARIRELDSMIKDAVKEGYVAKEHIDAWKHERKAAHTHLETFKSPAR